MNKHLNKIKIKYKQFAIIAFLIFAFSNVAFCQNIKVDSLYSPSVELTLKYTVILPEKYDQDSTKKYPVMYLLHGHTGNYTSWLTYAKLDPKWSTEFQTIIILPDAGNSWYVNWTGQTDKKLHKWEDMIIKDLLPDIAKKYRVQNKRVSTSIGGLSMGGYGALAVGLRNTERFGAIFSIAGAINFSKNVQQEFERDTLDWNSPILWSDGKNVIDVTDFSTQNERTPKGLVFENSEQARNYDPYLLLEKIEIHKLPYIITICGMNDYFIEDTRSFRNSIKSRSKNYAFIEIPGEHEVPFWEDAMKLIFPILERNRKHVLKNGEGK